jgi:UPF0755 protein
LRSLAANLLTLLVALGVIVVGAALWGQRQWTAPGPAEQSALFEVPRGAGLDAIAEGLFEAGLIESPLVFRLGARYSGLAGRLRFGEYEVPAEASPRELAELLASGRSVQYSVTVPEGLTSAEVVALLEDSPLLTGEIEAVPAEGSLAPETYSVQRGDARAEVMARMQALQAEILAEVWESRDPDIPLDDPEEALVLASIVEKETGVSGERAQVAGVFHNRLRRGMRLQSDPTIIYGITEGEEPLGRPLTRADIERRTDWNTYQIDGLPPTPIANPGREAIEAAVRPAETDYLYFVADGSGGHAFAETLEGHNRNVRAWRAIEAERRTP